MLRLTPSDNYQDVQDFQFLEIFDLKLEVQS